MVPACDEAQPNLFASFPEVKPARHGVRTGPLRILASLRRAFQTFRARTSYNLATAQSARFAATHYATHRTALANRATPRCDPSAALALQSPASQPPRL